MYRFFTITLFVLSITLSAQDKIAEEILNKLSLTTKSYNNIKLDFNFIFENKSQNIHDKRIGKLELQGDKFRLVIADQTIINDGKTQWIYLSDLNEVQIIKHELESEMMNLNKLFTIYENGYKYKYIGTKNKKGISLEIIDLLPEKSNPYIKVTLEINAVKKQLTKISIFDKNGGTYTYEVTAFTVNSDNLSPFIFNLSDYPDVDIIDLR